MKTVISNSDPKPNTIDREAVKVEDDAAGANDQTIFGALRQIIQDACTDSDYLTAAYQPGNRRAITAAGRQDVPDKVRGRGIRFILLVHRAHLEGMRTKAQAWVVCGTRAGDEIWFSLAINPALEFQPGRKGDIVAACESETGGGFKGQFDGKRDNGSIRGSRVKRNSRNESHHQFRSIFALLAADELLLAARTIFRGIPNEEAVVCTCIVHCLHQRSHIPAPQLKIWNSCSSRTGRSRLVIPGNRSLGPVLTQP